MSKGIQLSGKRVLYTIYKKTNCKLYEFSFCGLSGAGGRGRKGEHAAVQVLNRLRKKGLVKMTNFGDKNVYYLTDAGDEVAKEIAKEIDDYKAW